MPGIHADMGGGRDRYMVFNAGRYAAFEEWFGQAALFTRTVPTASAVGIGSGALAIYALGGRDAGLPVENPRQVPAYRYSARYGRCRRASRAARSCAACRYGRATAPTRRCCSSAAPPASSARTRCTTATRGSRRSRRSRTWPNCWPRRAGADSAARDGHDAPRAAFDAFTELRVYIVRDTDAPLLREMVAERFGRTARIEFAQADLCRRELLVEIEGLATL